MTAALPDFDFPAIVTQKSASDNFLKALVYKAQMGLQGNVLQAFSILATGPSVPYGNNPAAAVLSVCAQAFTFLISPPCSSAR
jgi:hypothetical protein